MLRLMLEQVVNNPGWGNVVVLTPSRSMEVFHRHRMKSLDQDLPNGGKPSKVKSERHTGDVGEPAAGVAIRVREQSS